jgi:hypothetical protein
MRLPAWDASLGGMVIALLAVLGVDLIVIVAFLAVVLSRRRWVSHQPDAFKGAIRVVDGEVPGLRARWQRGYGRWVRDVLVWTKAPLLFANELVAVDRLVGEPRAAEPGEVKRVGTDPVILPLAVDGGARVEVAAAGADRERALGPLAAPGATTYSAEMRCRPASPASRRRRLSMRTRPTR